MQDVTKHYALFRMLELCCPYLFLGYCANIARNKGISVQENYLLVEICCFAAWLFVSAYNEGIIRLFCKEMLQRGWGFKQGC
jgi:hypothetical protein